MKKKKKIPCVWEENGLLFLPVRVSETELNPGTRICIRADHLMQSRRLSDASGFPLAISGFRVYTIFLIFRSRE